MIKDYFRLVRFSHTVFALPFALVAYVYAVDNCQLSIINYQLLKIVLCMVFARNAAMGFNRWADRKIDAQNPRTSDREIPAGKISPRAAIWFVVINAMLFVVCTAFINKLTLILSPVALLVLLGYSYTKRFTALSHIVLGMALAIAPVGAYIAVTGTVSFGVVILAVLVLTWVAGFDILYARADREFDRTHGLHSVPARFLPRTALIISVLLHLVTAYAVAMLGFVTHGGVLYWVGAGIFVALLVLQHTRLRLAFDWVNGVASVMYAIFVILDILF